MVKVGRTAAISNHLRNRCSWWMEHNYTTTFLVIATAWEPRHKSRSHSRTLDRLFCGEESIAHREGAKSLTSISLPTALSMIPIFFFKSPWSISSCLADDYVDICLNNSLQVICGLESLLRTYDFFPFQEQDNCGELHHQKRNVGKEFFSYLWKILLF